jgi:hypothetical protein
MKMKDLSTKINFKGWIVPFLPNGYAHGWAYYTSPGSKMTSCYNHGNKLFTSETFNKNYQAAVLDKNVLMINGYYKSTSSKFENNWILEKFTGGFPESVVFSHWKRNFVVYAHVCPCGYHHKFVLNCLSRPLFFHLLRPCPNTNKTRFLPLTYYKTPPTNKDLKTIRTKVCEFAKLQQL